MSTKTIGDGFIQITGIGSSANGTIAGNLTMTGNVTLPAGTTVGGVPNLTNALDAKLDTVTFNSSIANYSTTTQMNTALGLKANQSTTYTKTESDNLLNAKLATTTFDTTIANYSTTTQMNTALGLKANNASPTFSGTVTASSTTSVLLPALTAVQYAGTALSTTLNGKANLSGGATFTGNIVLPTTTNYGTTNIQTLLDAKLATTSFNSTIANYSTTTQMNTALGLKVNTSDYNTNKTSTDNAIAAKAPLDSPTFIGNVDLPTTTFIGTSNLVSVLEEKAPLDSPTFTGIVSLPTTTLYNGTNISTLFGSGGEGSGGSGTAVVITPVEITGVTLTDSFTVATTNATGDLQVSVTPTFDPETVANALEKVSPYFTGPTTPVSNSIWPVSGWQVSVSSGSSIGFRAANTDGLEIGPVSDSAGRGTWWVLIQFPVAVTISSLTMLGANGQVPIEFRLQYSSTNSNSNFVNLGDLYTTTVWANNTERTFSVVAPHQAYTHWRLFVSRHGNGIVDNCIVKGLKFTTSGIFGTPTLRSAIPISSSTFKIVLADLHGIPISTVNTPISWPFDIIMMKDGYIVNSGNYSFSTSGVVKNSGGFNNLGTFSTPTGLITSNVGVGDIRENPRFITANTVANDFGNTYGWGTDSGWAVTASSEETSSGFTKEKAFDKTINTGWTSATGVWNVSTGYSTSPQWIAIKFPEKVYMRSFSIQTFSAAIRALTRVPREFEIQGSDDGSNWTVLQSYTNQINWQDSEVRTFENIPSTSPPYFHFRLLVQRINNNDAAAIGELKFFTQATNTTTTAGTLTVNGVANITGDLTVGGAVSLPSLSNVNYGSVPLSTTLASKLDADVVRDIGSSSLSIGAGAGTASARTFGVALGNGAGQTGQGSSAIALGAFAGNTGQGGFSIAIGNSAGQTNQAANSIVLNASGSALNNNQTNDTESFFVKPIKSKDETSKEVLMYNRSSGEITSTPLTNIGGGSSISMSMFYLANSTNAVTNQGNLTFKFFNSGIVGNNKISLTPDGLNFINTATSNASCMVNCNIAFQTTANQMFNVYITKINGGILFNSPGYFNSVGHIDVKSLSFLITLAPNERFAIQATTNTTGADVNVLQTNGQTSSSVTLIEVN